MGQELEEAIYSQLSATTAITGLVGTRIYPVIAPQGEVLPYVIYQKISETPIHAMSADPQLRERRYQFTVYSTNYDSVIAIAKQLKTALQDYQTSINGLFGDATSGVTVQRIFFDMEIDLHSLEPDVVQSVFGRAQDYTFWAST